MDEKIMYANGFGISASQNDYCISFVTSVPTLPGNGEKIELVDSARIILSFGYAKRLAEKLNERIQKHEEKYGPIADLLEDRMISNGNEAEKDESAR